MRCVLNQWLPSFVQIFFREERLPIAEGWKRSTTLITLAALEPVVNDIQNASQWTADNKCPSIVVTRTSNITETI